MRAGHPGHQQVPEFMQRNPEEIEHRTYYQNLHQEQARRSHYYAQLHEITKCSPKTIDNDYLFWQFSTTLQLPRWTD